MSGLTHVFTLLPKFRPPSHTWQVLDVTGTIHTSFAEFMYFLEREDPLLRVMHASEFASTWRATIGLMFSSPAEMACLFWHNSCQPAEFSAAQFQSSISMYARQMLHSRCCTAADAARQDS